MQSNKQVNRILPRRGSAMEKCT